MSRATRTIALLWREWWDENGDGIEALGTLRVVVPIALWLIGAAAGTAFPHARDTLHAPNDLLRTIGFGGILAVVALLAGLAVRLPYLCIRDTYRALRHAWERAGREG